MPNDTTESHGYARGLVLSVNRGVVRPFRLPHRPGRSAIDKQPVHEPVTVGVLGLAGDEQANPRFHGGPDKAVYVYAAEDLAWWSAELGMPLPPGFIGENLTVAGIDLHALRAGDELHAGSAVLVVTMPRVPCSTLAARVGVRGFEKRFARALRTGVYCAVAREGVVQEHDAVTVVRTRADGPTIRDAAAAMFAA